MKRVIYGATLLLLLVLTFVAGRWHSTGGPHDEAAAGRKVLYYVDPMNPGHTSDKPGIAPCGMKMEPVYAGQPDTARAPQDASTSIPPGAVKISPERQQLIGVKVTTVTRGPVESVLRTTGRVAADETRVSRIVAASDGWIRNTYDGATGTYVKKGQRLASLYSAGLLTAQRSYFLALTAADAVKTRGKEAAAQIGWTVSTVEQPLDALRTLGMGEEQIQEITRTREFAELISLVSPATGYIVARNVSAGQRFEKGTELYRVADLKKVWVLADLFTDEARQIRAGGKATLTLPQQRRMFHAVVGPALPLFDPTARTLKVRLELDNPDYALRPDMFVDVEFPIHLPDDLTVPADAVLDSGLKKTVFVDRGNGLFEPRLVETGWRRGDRVEITKGLMEGERIVVSGNFLIDSESRMKMAAAGMQTSSQAPQAAERAKDPVCGMEVTPAQAKAAGLVGEFRGKTYLFSSPECKSAFQLDPARYTRKDDMETWGVGGNSSIKEKAGTTGAPVHNRVTLSDPMDHDPAAGTDRHGQTGSRRVALP
jgi:membrane fusion protein, copper/silver efflux system